MKTNMSKKKIATGRMRRLRRIFMTWQRDYIFIK